MSTPIPTRVLSPLVLVSLGSLFLGGCNPEETKAETRSAQSETDLSHWKEMSTDDFREAAKRASAAIGKRIEELKERVANSEAAAETETAIAKLEEKRKALAAKIADLSEATAETLDDAKKKIVDEFDSMRAEVTRWWNRGDGADK